jgi:hypothetical protein
MGLISVARLPTRIGIVTLTVQDGTDQDISSANFTEQLDTSTVLTDNLRFHSCEIHNLDGVPITVGFYPTAASVAIIIRRIGGGERVNIDDLYAQNGSAGLKGMRCRVVAPSLLGNSVRGRLSIVAKFLSVHQSA